jgi:hypothetical protein
MLEFGRKLLSGIAIEEPMIQGPDRRKSSVAGAYLAKYGLYMRLHRRLGDVEKSCNVLIGVPSDNPFKYCDLSRGQWLKHVEITVRCASRNIVD